MIGSIIGDIVGSRFEFDNILHKDFELFHPECTFTDDTVLTVATAFSLMNGLDLGSTYRKFARTYPHRSYGSMFSKWVASDDMEAYNSFGNGSAMRVAPVAYLAKTEDEVLKLAKMTALPTHNHIEGIKGAQATAMAIYLAKKGRTFRDIKTYIADSFQYSLNFKLDDIREHYLFDETCQGTVPYALQAVFEAENFEDAIRNAVSIGGDSDTVACIAGGFAEAAFGVPASFFEQLYHYLPPDLLTIMHSFKTRKLT